MKTRSIKIAGRTFELLFNYAALTEMERAWEDFDIQNLINYVKSSASLPEMIAILARQGEADKGRTLDVDGPWFAAHMRPNLKSIAKIQIAVNSALADGMLMETEEDDGESETDVILDELKKKETPGASPSGSSPPTA